MSDARHVRRLARRMDPEPAHAFQVCRNALALFDATRVLHTLGAAERRLLEAAALLHDIGYAVGARGHHKHARDLIMQQELQGFTDCERRIVACVARYHRKAHPAGGHAVFKDLNKADQRRVEKLAALLRIADGLDRSHEASCKRIVAEIHGRTVRLHAQQRRANDIDIWGAQRKSALFEEVFGVRAVIEGIAAARPGKKGVR